MHARDLLVISDLHLGEDLGAKSAETLSLEQGLIDFLDHHRTDGRRWRLVVNGDMVDLVGVMVMPADVGWVAALHPDDHHYGLGGSALAAVLKLHRIVEHHIDVFRALARFVGAGHQLSLVIGNHDAELHWPEVQELFTDALCILWSEQRAEHEPTADEVRESIGFHPWFFHEEGVAFIEHGHQYDPYCSFEDVLEPATDEAEIDINVGALLLRYVGSRFSDSVHDAWGNGFWGHIRFWLSQGPDRAAGIGQGYVDMCRRLVAHWRARRPERVAARRARARARAARLAKTLRLPEEKLVELARLSIPPVVVDLNRLVQAVMLDRLLLLLCAPILVLLPLMTVPWAWLPGALGVVAIVLAAWGWWASTARESADPRATMRATARRIRDVLRVPIVVMGHSHDPCAEVEGDGGYYNTGTWVPHSDRTKAFTHVRIERTKAGVRALLCQWRDGASRVFVPEPVQTE